MALARLCLPAVLLPHVVAAYTFVWVHIPTSTCRLAAIPSPQPPRLSSPANTRWFRLICFFAVVSVVSYRDRLTARSAT